MQKAFRARRSKMNKWELIHAYRNLAESGGVPFLKCPDDNSKLITVIGKDDEPALWCIECNTTFTPGLELFERINTLIDAKRHETD